MKCPEQANIQPENRSVFAQELRVWEGRIRGNMKSTRFTISGD